MKKILLSLFLTVVCLSSYAQHFITLSYGLSSQKHTHSLAYKDVDAMGKEGA